MNALDDLSARDARPASSSAPTPRNDTPEDRDAELRAKILAFLDRGVVSTIDVRIAEATGIADRDVLRPLLAGLAIDGRIIVEPLPNAAPFARWIDNAPPWAVRLAPEGTPSLEDRIVAALAEAGTHGRSRAALAYGLIDEARARVGNQLVDAFSPVGWNFDRASEALKALIARGAVVCIGAGRHAAYALSPAEWARRIAALVERAQGQAIRTEARAAFLAEVERLLVGTEG